MSDIVLEIKNLTRRFGTFTAVDALTLSVNVGEVFGLLGYNGAGMVFVNHPTWTTADLPFGGIKNSGYGRELSSMGIQEFVNKKLVRVSSLDAPA